MDKMLMDNMSIWTKCQYGQNFNTDKMLIWTKFQYGQNVNKNKMSIWTKCGVGHLDCLGMHLCFIWSCFSSRYGQKENDAAVTQIEGIWTAFGHVLAPWSDQTL